MRVTSGPPVARKLLTLASMIAVTGLFLAACSSGASSNSSTSSTGSTSSTSSSPNGTGNQGGSSTTSGGSTAASKLSALETNVQSAKGGTFKLTYAETSSSNSGTLTFEQMPPKYRFSVGGATAADIINTGTKTYVCSGQGARSYCYGYSSSATNPFATLLNLITGASVLTEFHKLQSGLAARLQGVQVNFSNQTFGGQPSQCASGTYKGTSFKYCLTNSGVLAYAGGSGAKGFGSISLTSYSTSASASDFVLPAGATIVGG